MAAARYKMISIPEALDTVLQHTPVLATETVSLQSALGRVLAGTVTARDALPPFPASIKVRRSLECMYAVVYTMVSIGQGVLGSCSNLKDGQTAAAFNTQSLS